MTPLIFDIRRYSITIDWKFGFSVKNEYFWK